MLAKKTINPSKIYQFTFNNPLKPIFFDKKYPKTMQNRPTQIVNSIFLIEHPFLTDFYRLLL